MNNRILIIDDDEDLAEELAESFSAHGFSVSRVNNGLDGRKELTANVYNFLILDIKIPGINGFEILEWLIGSGLQIKTIVLTGMPFPDESQENRQPEKSEKRMLLKTAAKVINKPFPTGMLIRLIERMKELAPFPTPNGSQSVE